MKKLIMLMFLPFCLFAQMGNMVQKKTTSGFLLTVSDNSPSATMSITLKVASYWCVNKNGTLSYYPSSTAYQSINMSTTDYIHISNSANVNSLGITNASIVNLPAQINPSTLIVSSNPVLSIIPASYTNLRTLVITGNNSVSSISWSSYPIFEYITANITSASFSMTSSDIPPNTTNFYMSQSGIGAFNFTYNPHTWIDGMNRVYIRPSATSNVSTNKDNVMQLVIDLDNSTTYWTGNKLIDLRGNCAVVGSGSPEYNAALSSLAAKGVTVLTN